MKKLKKLTKSSDTYIFVNGPFSESVIELRKQEYDILSDTEFQKKYREYIYVPATIEIDGKKFELQFNYCTNPLCKWFLQDQKKYNSVKSKPSRYKLGIDTTGKKSTIECNPKIEDSEVNGLCIGNRTTTLSNWSVAEEIKRLVTINSTTLMEDDYEFHKGNCTSKGLTPFDNPKLFHKKGKSTSNSQKYQCQECMKMTNILPMQDESFSYHQKRNDVLLDFMKDIISRTPVKRTCEKLGIGSKTYYTKLEWVYRKCLEFLDVHETIPLGNKEFNSLWLNTDSLIYNLNNIRQNGCGKQKPIVDIEKKLSTYLIGTSEMHSWYVFRADIAYDFDTSLSDVEVDTDTFKCDHTYSFLRKNERLRYSYAPKAPRSIDTQTTTEYIELKNAFASRKTYVSGCHTKSSYTEAAHFWLINNALKFKKLYVVSDNDATLQGAVFRGFKEHFTSKDAHYFICQVDKSLELSEAGELSFKNRNELRKWAKAMGYVNSSMYEIAKFRIEADLTHHDFYKYTTVNGIKYPISTNIPYRSLYADKDEGYRLLNCHTDTTSLSNKNLSELLIQVSNRSTNNFFQSVRRKISILERPIVSGRGDGKSYIYANYNPKYAQYMVTILRTVYNFCWTTKKDGKIMTPAQRLGIADKKYELKDIIYFK